MPLALVIKMSLCININFVTLNCCGEGSFGVAAEEEIRPFVRNEIFEMVSSEETGKKIKPKS